MGNFISDVAQVKRFGSVNMAFLKQMCTMKMAKLLSLTITNTVDYSTKKLIM